MQHNIQGHPYKYEVSDSLDVMALFYRKNPLTVSRLHTVIRGLVIYHAEDSTGFFTPTT